MIDAFTTSIDLRVEDDIIDSFYDKNPEDLAQILTQEGVEIESK